MKKTILTLLLTATLFFNGCAKDTYIKPNVPVLKTLTDIRNLKVHINSKGGLDRGEFIKTAKYIKEVKAYMNYYKSTINKYNTFATKWNKDATNAKKEK